MLRLGMHSVLTGLLVLLAGPALARAAAGGQTPDFSEVYDAVRAHLAGANEADLNRAAVQGLVSALAPKVSLLTSPGDGPETGAGTPLVSKSSLFDAALAYVRVERVGPGLAEAVRNACQRLAGTNQLKGVVLDLRYADGSDYAAAAATADLFLKKQRPLLNWGAGMANSTPKNDALNAPVAALVNRQTARAAEALAAMVRETAVGLILGSQTAGQAMVTQDFPLKNGDRLRIATGPIQLGDGSPISAGVKPDLAVEVNPLDERAYYADAYKGMPPTNHLAGALGLTNQVNGTNSPLRPRYNEAQLVRERREGLSPDAELLHQRNHEPEKPLVRDPVLARALDLLKALALVRQARS